MLKNNDIIATFFFLGGGEDEIEFRAILFFLGGGVGGAMYLGKI